MTTEGEAEEMLSLITEVNHEGETSTAWQRLKAKLQHLLSIPERAGRNMAEEELRARAARQEHHQQAHYDSEPEEAET